MEGSEQRRRLGGTEKLWKKQKKLTGIGLLMEELGPRIDSQLSNASNFASKVAHRKATMPRLAREF